MSRKWIKMVTLVLKNAPMKPDNGGTVRRRRLRYNGRLRGPEGHLRSRSHAAAHTPLPAVH